MNVEKPNSTVTSHRGNLYASVPATDTQEHSVATEIQANGVLSCQQICVDLHQVGFEMKELTRINGVDIKPLTNDLNILHEIEQEKSFTTEQENLKHEVHDPEGPNPKTCSLARTTKKYKLTILTFLMFCSPGNPNLPHCN